MEELLRECCDIKPKVQALVEELILGRPGLSEAVMKVNDTLDSTIDRAHAHLEKLGLDLHGAPDMDESESDNERHEPRGAGGQLGGPVMLPVGCSGGCPPIPHVHAVFLTENAFRSRKVIWVP